MPERSEAGETSQSPEARARSRALRLLAHRERTRLGVERLLARAGFPRSIVAPILDDLEVRGLLSDLRFARLYLSSQSRARPRSRSLLRRDLLRAGVGREAAAQAMAEAEFTEESLALAAARNKRRTAGNDPARLFRLLRARGFSPGIVRRTLTELYGFDPIGGGGARAASDGLDDAGDEDV